jgi:hypothetical protein
LGDARPAAKFLLSAFSGEAVTSDFASKEHDGLSHTCNAASIPTRDRPIHFLPKHPTEWLGAETGGGLVWKAFPDQPFCLGDGSNVTTRFES